VCFALSQVATAIAGAAIGPAVSGITLGMFQQARFNRQNGINQAYNHAGNAVGAGLSGLLGWKFGLPAVFWLAVAFGVASIVAVLRIPREAIDDRAARGLRDGAESNERARRLTVLFECKPLLVLAAALALFHLGNGAMLPLYGLAVVAAKQGNRPRWVPEVNRMPVLPGPDGHVGVVTALSAAASAITVVLARAFLKQTVAPHCWIGLCAVICGLAALHLG
jgi:MFS family permease